MRTQFKKIEIVKDYVNVASTSGDSQPGLGTGDLRSKLDIIWGAKGRGNIVYAESRAEPVEKMLTQYDV